jgi:hypothetical protein
MKLWWFIKESKSYINPKGVKSWVKFGVKLPVATVKFYCYWIKDEYRGFYYRRDG